MGKETVFELGVTPNRGDCLSMIGAAREVAAVTNRKLSVPVWKPPRGVGRMTDQIRVSVKHRSRCPRYCARIINGVRIGPSPSWIVKRLAASGIRSINNVVDATNYVMMETGQPLHAFDHRFVGDGKIIVKLAADGMSFTTLDGTSHQLSTDDLMICDGRAPVAIAGVMGGENSEVRQSTTCVVLESACFEPTGVRRTSRRLGLASESSRRFERGVDINGVLPALHRLTQIIIETAGGIPTRDWVDIHPRKVRPRRIGLSSEETNRILGTELGADDIVTLLERLELKVARPKGRRRGPGKVMVTVPTFRPDLERPIDLVEEVARLYGYGSIVETMPVVGVAPLRRPRFWEQENRARQALSGAGLTEVVLFGFTEEGSLKPFEEVGGRPIHITNPLSQDQGVMLTTLLPGLLDVIGLNVSRQRVDCRAFTLQYVFHRPMGVGPSKESRLVSGAMTGLRYPSSWERSGEMLDFYDAKGAVESLLQAFDLDSQAIYQRGDGYSFLHPGRFAFVLIGNERVGFVGQLHPDVAAQWDLDQEVYIFELEFEKLAELSVVAAPKFRQLSRFPFVDRDLALLLSERIPSVEVAKAIQDSGVELVESVRIFDVYRGRGVPDGSKSLGVKLRFARGDGTLTDDEVNVALAKVVEGLQAKLGASLRT
jgi:phenylalanyl-tRNA synthetase beta chain